MPAGILSSQARNALNERRMKALEQGQIDNSRLYAGSSMYYYCKLCGLLSDTKPEGWLDLPSRHCKACLEMMADSEITADDVKNQAGVLGPIPISNK